MAACRRAARSHDLVVVDCVTVWVSNLMERGDDDAMVLAAADDLAKLLRERRVSVILVSNEVGEGVHPPTELGPPLPRPAGRSSTSVSPPPPIG